MNTALRRATLALTHPLTVGAILVLLINDHLLRWRWPSWITGKLGDVAWLFFAPLAAAVVIAVILPRRVPRRSTWVFVLAAGAVAIPFAVGNVWPPALHAMRTIYGTLLGREALMVSDPSDLLALPVLFLTWRLWQSVDVRRERVPRRAWGLLLLASLATVANAAGPDYGIRCLSEGDGKIVASGGAWAPQRPFVSRDGGMTWSEDPAADEELECEEQAKPQTLEARDSSEVYRFEPGVRVEVSHDGGQTWTTEIELTGDDARAAYRRAVQGTSNPLGPGPLDALEDPTTGNVILAMGREGVLVGSTDGQWHRVAVGRYRYVPLDTVSQIAFLLQGEIWLAASVALLAFAAWSSRLRSPWALGLIVLVGLAWCGVAVVTRPATASGYLSVFAFFPALILVLAALPLAVWQGWRGFRASPARPLAAVPVALAGGLLYLAPFALWGYGIIARYGQALGVAVLLVALSWIPAWYVAIRARRSVQAPEQPTPGWGRDETECRTGLE